MLKKKRWRAKKTSRANKEKILEDAKKIIRPQN
jgi:hypothetical protein